jgi:hypothetical protein
MTLHAPVSAMIVFTGLGFLVLVITFGCSLAASFITNELTGSRDYWRAHKWPLAVALLVAGLACWLLGKHLHKKPLRRMIDLDTGEELILRPSHTFFFIPVLYWGPILALTGLGVLFREGLR